MPSKTPRAHNVRLIETDTFSFEFLSRIAERESWRKEIHRSIYHVHEWWAKRLGSVFRGILLGTMLPQASDLAAEFYRLHPFSNEAVFDPFMGSGATGSRPPRSVRGPAARAGCAPRPSRTGSR